MGKQQQQKNFFLQLPTQLNNSLINPQQFIPSTSTSAALAAFYLPLTQPNLNAQQLNFSNQINLGSSGSLTTGSSAQAHALATASVNNQTNNLMGLNSLKNTSNSTSNALAQIAMTQLMMQKINSNSLSNNIIPISQSAQMNSISSQQQIAATNNFLASLGFNSASTTNGVASTPHLNTNISNGGININSQQHTSVSTQASCVSETTISNTPTTSSINTVSVQQQQELLLQAALIQGIQSVS